MRYLPQNLHSDWFCPRPQIVTKPGCRVHHIINDLRSVEHGGDVLNQPHVIVLHVGTNDIFL